MIGNPIRALGQYKVTHRRVRPFPLSQNLKALNSRYSFCRSSAETFTRFYYKRGIIMRQKRLVNAHCNERNNGRPPRPILNFDHHIVVRWPDLETS